MCAPAGRHGVGEACSVVSEPLGADSCDRASKCMDVDWETGIGTCVGFCLGPETEPTCPLDSGPTTRCKKLSQGSLNLCLSNCNPLLAGECPTGQNCVANFVANELEGFICFPPAALGTSGDECSCANCCAPQHMCVTAERYGPGCADERCCTELCDVDDASFTCEDADQVCVPLFDANTPEIGHVGNCVMP